MVFKAFENGKRCDFVNRQPLQTVSTGRHLFFFKLKQLIFRLILVNNDEQRYWVNFFFLLFLSFILQPESTCQLINMAIDTGTIIKTTSTYVYAANDSVHYFYVLVRYFLVLYIHLWIFCGRLSKHWEYSLLVRKNEGNNQFVCIQTLCRRKL